MELSRYSVNQVGDDESPQEPDNAWMLSYLDVLTLLIAFFVLLLAMSEPKQDEQRVVETMVEAPEGGAQSDSLMAAAAVGSSDSVLQGGIGVLPELNAPVVSDSGNVDPQAQGSGVIEINPDDDYQEQFGDLEDSLNALALQGVDATPGREGLTLRIADNLLFASGESELRYEGMMLISQLVGILASFQGEISIEGHTDNIPINTARFPSNWELSSARAISVLRHLEYDGIDATRMRAVGYADTRPLQDNNSAGGRAANRRVELILREP